jgi:hypothetical protein
MVIHLKNLFDWGIGRKKIVMAAGELLERAFLRRGKWDASYPTKIHGVKERHQPWTGRKIISLDEYRRHAAPDLIVAA